MTAPPTPALADLLAGRVWGMHTGALGDFVLIWPLLRVLLRHPGLNTLTLAAHSSHTRLATVALIEPNDTLSRLSTKSIDAPWATRLWVPDAPTDTVDADVVISFLADPSSPAGRVYVANIERMFPLARVHVLSGPAATSHAELWSEIRVHPHARVDPCDSPDGPIVLFVGAGGERKRWPMSCWQALADTLRADDPSRSVHVIAGPVEAERLSTPDRASFDAIGGHVCDDMQELVSILRHARAYVGVDTGPTHLAAQLGIPTLALFGPTDPAVWSPIGPRVHVLAPPKPECMDWLSVERVYKALRVSLLR